jgi:hexokinase
LFDYIATSLASFLSSRGVTGSEVKPLSLGFTFSFPCQQDSLSSARLTRWTKGFTCPGVQDNDVVCLLQEAIDRQGAKVKVKALINDNVGALLAGALAHRRCSIGLILGQLLYHGCILCTTNLIC